MRIRKILESNYDLDVTRACVRVSENIIFLRNILQLHRWSRVNVLAAPGINIFEPFILRVRGQYIFYVSVRMNNEIIRHLHVSRTDGRP